MLSRLSLLLSFLLPGCAFVSQSAEDARLDPDGDGVTLDNDCDSTDPTVSAIRRWFADADGDAFGDPTHAMDACGQPDGYVADATDCDDASAAISPAADEVCATPEDDNCDGLTDDGVDAPSWYVDGDDDGYGDSATEWVGCTAPADSVAFDGDCDDDDAAVSPGADERCGGGDEDCDGLIDDDDANVVGATDSWEDNDGDGYGAGRVVALCEPRAGMVENDDDCDDSLSTSSPVGVEICGGRDEDCDGLTDDADPSVTATTDWYADGDADGYGVGAVVASSCVAPAGSAARLLDCDDAEPAVHPGAVETCATLADDDCNGDANELGADACTNFYVDSDGDGYGVASAVQCRCVATVDYTAVTSTDCDDADRAVNPGETESCATAVDDDCSGSVNDLGADGCTVRYLDADRDGYGSSASECRCSTEGSYDSALATDCDDASSSASPALAEIWYDGIDEDCDGGSDYDQDGDGYDALAWSGSDCADTDSTIAPDVAEVCDDGIDNNCDDSAGTCAWSGAVDALSDVDATLYGAESGDMAFGAALSIGPLDASGGDDVLIGAPSTDSSSGAVYAFRSAPSGTHSSWTADESVTARRGGGELGASVAVLLDGSDRVTFLSEPFYEEASNGGGVWTVDARSNGDVSDVACRLYYPRTGASTGVLAVAVTGDQDGDGGPEVVFGVPGSHYASSNDGMVTVASYMRCGSESVDFDEGWYGAGADAELGVAVATGQDLTGDGVDDVLAGAPGDASGAGGVYLLELDTRGYAKVSSAATAEWQGVYAGDAAGSSVAMVGDVTGDGLADALAGAPWSSDGGDGAGQAYLLAGGTSGVVSLSAADAVFTGAAIAMHLGSALTALDLDNDGQLDLALGASGDADGAAYGTDAGHTYVYYGPVSGAFSSAAADVTVTGMSGDALGTALAAGDVDADGIDDLMIGAPDDDAHRGAGSVYVLYGRGF